MYADDTLRTGATGCMNILLTHTGAGCQAQHGDSGTFQITLKLGGGRVSKIETSGPKALRATLQCQEEKLRAATMPSDSNLSRLELGAL